MAVVIVAVLPEIVKLPPDMLAEIVYKYGVMYNAYTIVDITGGMGVATVLKLLEMDYKYLHYDDPKSRKLSDKYGYLGLIAEFDNWCMNYDGGQL